MEDAFIPQDELFQNIISNMHIGVFWKDKNRRFIGANKYFYEYYDFTPEDIIGKTDEDVGWHINPEPFKKEELNVLNGKVIINDVGNCIAKGINRDIMATKMPIYDKDNNIIGFWGYFIDISNIVGEINKLKLECSIDPLTKLKNRRGFEEELTSYITAYNKNHSDFGLFFIDIDHFKDINDRYGHDVGDIALIQTSAELLKLFASTAVVVRMGGDEFVLIKQVTDKSEFGKIEATINKGFSSLHIKGFNELIKVSIGGALYSETLDRDELVKLADMRMYDVKKAKKVGR